jgi:hypothetical protein
VFLLNSPQEGWPKARVVDYFPDFPDFPDLPDSRLIRVLNIFVQPVELVVDNVHKM